VTVVINEEGDTVTYETVEEYLTSIVEANESQTLIVTIDGNQYYISEEYLRANNGVAPTTVDPEALPDGVYYIDAVAGIVNNFNEFVTTGPVTVINEENEEVIYETIEQYFEHLVELNETPTLLRPEIDGDGRRTGVYTYFNESAFDEDGEPIEADGVTINVVSTDEDNQITVGSDGGAFYQKVNNIITTVGDYTVAAEDETILIDATCNATITIPAAASDNEGRILAIRKMDSDYGILTFSEEITLKNGDTFTQSNMVTTFRIQSDGTNWYLISGVL